jgi:hypothetical protein
MNKSLTRFKVLLIVWSALYGLPGHDYSGRGGRASRAAADRRRFQLEPRHQTRRQPVDVGSEKLQSARQRHDHESAAAGPGQAIRPDRHSAERAFGPDDNGEVGLADQTRLARRQRQRERAIRRLPHCMGTIWPEKRGIPDQVEVRLAVAGSNRRIRKSARPLGRRAGKRNPVSATRSRVSNLDQKRCAYAAEASGLDAKRYGPLLSSDSG